MSDAPERIGELAVARGYVTPEQIQECLRLQRESEQAGPRLMLGQILVARGHLTTAQFVELLEATRGAGPRESAPIREWRLGRFTLVREIARGGMGTVFEAEDPELRRRVALKVIRDDEVDFRLLERFRREAQLEARLRHPGIVPVHEVGSAQDRDGRVCHYIAMELVAGGTLSQALAQNRFGLPDLLRILEEIARAAGYAHVNGVVHRDLKPANILIDASGRALLADFGLARYDSAEGALTKTNAMMGTPQYMAPEQVEGKSKQVTPATDVFALGAILYEILTGRSPFQATAVTDIYRKILTDEPVPPSRIRRVAHDLELICLKAMDKSPERRYLNATEFADDLARHRRGEPILASAPSIGHRLARFVHRRRVPVIAAVVSLGVAGAVLAAVLPGAIRARRELCAAEEAERSRQAASAQVDEARRWIQSLQLLLREEEDRPEESAAAAAEAKRLLEEALRTSPDHAEAMLEMGRLHSARQEWDEAKGWFGRAIAANPRLSQARIERAALALRRHAARAVENTSGPRTWRLAVEASARDASAEAASDLEPAIAGDDVSVLFAEGLLRHVRGETGEAVRLLRDYVKRISTSADGWLFLSQALDAAGDVPGAIEAAERAIRLRPRMAWTRAQLAGLLDRAGRVDRAVEAYGQAIRLSERSAFHNNRANLHLRLGNAAAAKADYDRAVELDASNAMARFNRGRFREAEGDLEGARADLEKACELDGGYAEAYQALAGVHLARRDGAAALSAANRAVDLAPDDSGAWNQRGVVRVRTGDGAGGIADFTRAIELAPGLVEARVNRASVRRVRGETAEAERDLDEAIERAPGFAAARYEKGLILASRKDWAGAVREFTRALESRPGYAEAHNDRAIAHLRLGDEEAALRDYAEAVRANPKFAAAWNNRGLLHKAAGRLRDAIADFDRAVGADPRWPDAYVNRSGCHRALADAEPARAGEHLRAALADLERALEVAPADWKHRATVTAWRDELKGE